MNTLVCVKVGTKYSADYVNKLASMAKRHTTVPYDFYCLTDDPCGVDAKTMIVKKLPKNWWAKLFIFNVLWQSPRVVYLDLDTVIVDNIDFLFRYDGEFCILKDFWMPCYNSSVMAFRAGFGYKLWKEYEDSAGLVEASYPGDQDFITAQVPNADLWPKYLVGSYKANCLNDGPKKFPIVCFHGEPKPHQFTEGWVHESWN